MLIKVIFVLLVIICISAYRYYFGQKYIPEPNLRGNILKSSLIIGKIKRKYLYFIPSKLSQNVNLLFVLHGAQDTGTVFRKRTAYAFDKIAEDENLIVVYPNGYKKSWNDCRKQAKYPSKVKQIDDFEFLKEIKSQISNDHNLEVRNTFLFGYSNGGQLVNRICLEHPEWIDAACVIAANLPVPDNLECKPKNIAVPMVYFCGTNDKTNPYNGGLVNVLGLKKLGYIKSFEETIKYWCSLSDYKFIQSDSYVPQEEKSSIEKKIWKSSEGSIIVQFVVHGGGHTIPNKDMNFPRILGLTNHDMNSYQEIWDFFKEQINKSTNAQQSV
jgi:polyhydroxybutyrate depolymerase